MSLFNRALKKKRITATQLALESFKQARLCLALEAEANGKPFKEIEHTIYARLSNFAQFKEAVSMEHHEQWEIRVPKTEGNAGTGTIRIRKTQVPGADAVYVLTTKVKLNDQNDKTELEIPTNSDNFTLFKFLSDKGMVKERYRFPIEGTELVWEIDLYPKGEGQYHEWCKIDLEVSNRDDPIPALPIATEEVIMPVGYGRQDLEETEKKIREIYEKCFLAKNVFLDKLEEEQTQAEPPATATETPVEGDQTQNPENDTPPMVESPKPASVPVPHLQTEISVT